MRLQRKQYLPLGMIVGGQITAGILDLPVSTSSSVHPEHVEGRTEGFSTSSESFFFFGRFLDF